jgi:hypothetical protein
MFFNTNLLAVGPKDLWQVVRRGDASFPKTIAITTNYKKIILEHMAV